MVTCSVLIPAYNGEKYLQRALDSVINQTYKDFEVILIDDGATDSTPQICDEYGKKHNFIRVFHQKNIGLSKTREKLLEKVQGKYIFWLDQDDYFKPTLLEKAVMAFETTEADIVTWGEVRLSRTGTRETNVAKELGGEMWQQRAMWGLNPAPIYYSAKTELWNNIEGFPDDINLADDVWLTPQVVQKANHIEVIPDLLYFRELRNMDSVTRAYKASRICEEGITFYRVLKKNLDRNPNAIPLTLLTTRWLLIIAYCVNQVNPSLQEKQCEYIKSTLKDLDKLFPMKRYKKIRFMQFCVLNEINSICRLFGKSKIKKSQKNLWI